MAHGIMAEDTLFFNLLNGKPWHGLGTGVDGLVTVQDAIRLANLGWTVSKRDLFLASGTKLENNFAIVRDDINLPLGVVKGRYQILQNTEAFGVIDQMMLQGEARIDTAGSLFNGARTWMLVELSEALKIGDDKVLPHMMVSTTHDGTGAVWALLTGTRVVCMNTLRMAVHGAKREHKVRIPHVGNMEAKIREAMVTLGVAKDYFAALQAQAESMMRSPITEIQMQALVEGIFPTTKDESEKVPTRTLNMRQTVTDLFQTGGMGLDAYRGTAWGAYQAVVEYVDHHSTLKGQDGPEANDRRLDHIFFSGRGQDMKDKAQSILESIMDASVNVHPVTVPA